MPELNAHSHTGNNNIYTNFPHILVSPDFKTKWMHLQMLQDNNACTKGPKLHTKKKEQQCSQMARNHQTWGL